MLGVVDDAVLPRGNALDTLVAIDAVLPALGIVVQGAEGKLWRVADLKCHADRLTLSVRDGIASIEVRPGI